MLPTWEDVLRQGSNPPIPSYPLALEQFLIKFLSTLVSCGLRHHGFVFRELLLKLLHPLELRRLKTPIFKAPFIESCSANTIAAQYFGHGNTTFSLFEHATIWLSVNLDLLIKHPVVNTAINNRKFHFQNVCFGRGRIRYCLPKDTKRF